MSEKDEHNALPDVQTESPVPDLAQSRQVADHLKQAARALAMQSGSRRGIYRILGLKPRQRDRVFQLSFALAWVLFFAAPLVAGWSYLAIWVSPQFESETRFVLRSALPALPKENSPGDVNVASLKIVQDTLVVVSFLDSPSLVEKLDKKINLDSIYAQPEIDPISRLRPGQGLEDKSAYFQDFITTDVSSTSGIVTVKVRAFSPIEARDILAEITLLAEERVNLLNKEIWASVLSVSERNFDTALERLRQIMQSYTALQNETGVFDVTLEAEALSNVIGALRKELVSLENRRATLLLEVSESHINVIRLDQAIEVRTAQLARLEGEAAKSDENASTLSSTKHSFDTLQVELEIAQDRFKKAAAELEEAKLLSSIQLLFLDRFMGPTLPNDSAYPVYALEAAKVFLICLSAWGAVALGLIWLQRRLD